MNTNDTKQETKLESQNYFEESFRLPNPGLRAYFDRVRKGQPEVYRSHFYQGKDLNKILDGWHKVLRTISSEQPSLMEFENDLRGKVGPMSVMQPLDKRIPDIDAYYDLIDTKSKPILKEAMDLVLKDWAPYVGGIRLRSQDRTLSNMKLSTNSGSPYFTKRNKVVKDTVPVTITNLNQILDDKIYNSCAILGWRGQEGGPNKEDVKQRVVWMFPFAVNIRELQVYQPLIEAAQKKNLVPAWVSMDAVDEMITKLFDTKGRNDPIICTDFSKFDQHFNPDMQNCSKYILSKLLTPNKESKEWINEVFPLKYDIPLAYDWNTVRFGPHGMASGSGGTNADETLTHKALQHEAALTAGKHLNPYSMCLGDDGILTYPGIELDHVISTYSSHGQEMNKDKQYVDTETCIYLRRWHSNNYRIDGKCVGVYSTMRALGKLAEQERFFTHWNEKMETLRYLSIIENCKYHPLREEFAEYCMKGDKYRLGLDIPGFYDNLENVVKEAKDHMPDFLGYTREHMSDDTGINDWWIVKYVKSKR